MKVHTSLRWAAAALVAVMVGAGLGGPAGAAEDDVAPEPRHDSRIVGGTVAADGAWPTQVALVQRAAPSAAQGQFCGGTVVDRSWILTAAHCLADPPDWRPTPGQVDVLVGTNSLNGGGTRIRAVEFRIHPRWNSGILRNDVALVRLDHPVPPSVPVQELGSTSDVQTYQAVTATGWGALDDPPTQFPASLREVEMEISPGSDCAWWASIWDGGSQVCAFAVGKGVCFGDSGGPLLYDRGGEWVQLGISSYVLECGSYPSYFTKVPYYAPWIQAQIRYGPQPNASAFVKRQYLDLFGRQPTGAELFYGVAALDDGQTPAAFVAGLLDHATFRARSGGIVRLYRAIFQRLPETGGMTYWMGEITRGVSLKRIADLMVRAPEFVTLYGGTSDAEFVDLVYDNVLDRAPSPDEAEYWVDELASGRRTRGQVMVGFSESPEYRAQTAVESRTWGTAWALLRRVPTTTELAGWGPMTTTDLAQHLLTSWSYANRF